MSLAATQAFAARLLAEPGFLERFRDAPAETLKAFDLTEAEARVLLGLDLSRIGMVCEGYAGKRAERIESAFPWTLRALGPMALPAVQAHLAAFPAGAEEAAELRAFAARAPMGVEPEWRRRLVEDLLDVESALRARPPEDALPAARWSGDLRLRLAAGVALVRTRGDVAAALADGLAAQDHPSAPGDALARSTARGLHAERLAPEDAALLRACEAGATVAEAAPGAEAEARLRRWYATGVLVPRV